MKKTIITAIAAIMMTSGAHAACTTKADVAAFNNTNTYNKSLLSDRDKCWHDVYTTKDHGVDGNVFWLRVGGEYYSTALINLATKEQRDAWLGDIKADVSDSFEQAQDAVDQANEMAKIVYKIVEDTAEIDRLQKELNKALSDLEVELAKDLIGQLTQAQKDLMDANSILDSIAAELGVEQTDLKAVKDAIADSYTKGVNSVIPEDGINQSDVDKAFDDGYDDGLEVGFDQGVTDTLLDVSNIVGVFYESGMIIGQTLKDALDKAEMYQTKLAQAENYAETLSNNGKNIDVADTQVTLDVDMSEGLIINDVFVNGTHLKHSFDGKTFAAGDSIQFTIDEIITTEKMSVIMDSIEQAFDQGYNQGYDDGYADGYADGFADGVNSVK